MSEKRFRTRLLTRYDSMENWQAENPVLLEGEMGISLLAGQDGAKDSLLIKVGNGTDNYNDLPFVSAIAGDVYAWAKAEEKPTYTAEEIDGLADYIAGEIEDTNTKYQMVAGEDSKTFILQSQEKGETEWTNIYTLTIPEDITYTVETTEDGKVQFVPSEGEAVTIVQIESNPDAIATGSTKVPTAGAVAEYVESKVGNGLGDLNLEDAAVTGQFVTEVTQEDGQIAVKRSTVSVDDLTDFATNSAYDAETNKLATMQDVDQAAARVLRFKGLAATVADLPASDNAVGDVYHVKSTKAEYVWVEKEPEEGGDPVGEWEKLGNDMDLSAYPTKDEMDAELEKKQDLITEDNKLAVELVNGTASDTSDGLMSKEDKAKLD